MPKMTDLERLLQEGYEYADRRGEDPELRKLRKALEESHAWADRRSSRLDGRFRYFWQVLYASRLEERL